MDWTAVLSRARTITDVLEVVDEYLSTLTELDWRGLPEALRKPVIVATTDLERWHHAVVKVLGETPNPSRTLQDVAKISLHAVARIHQIRLRIDPRDDGTNDDEGYSAAPCRRRCA